MKIAYFDCSAGISGDMCLGALVDAGVNLKTIERGLKGLPVTGYKLRSKSVTRAGIAATKVDVILSQEKRSRGQGPRTWVDIGNIIGRSSLPVKINQKGLRIFRRLFESEGKVHNKKYDKTHLHELGAVDCIVDIFGTLIGLDALGIEKVYASAVNLGSGKVMTEHGMLPVPAPATAEILKGTPVYSSGIPFELTTPTGAVILSEIAAGFGDCPLMNLTTTGYGAGQKDFETFPNALRVLTGEAIPQKKPDGGHPRVFVIETNIDDMNPQIYGHVMELLFKAGALDVYLTPVIMKKGRPGIVLSLLCTEEKKAGLTEIIFRETTTIGLRFYEASRLVLDRDTKNVNTGIGKIKAKISTISDGKVRLSPEYEDCRRIAKKLRIPLIEVIRLFYKKG